MMVLQVQLQVSSPLTVIFVESKYKYTLIRKVLIWKMNALVWFPCMNKKN